MLERMWTKGTLLQFLLAMPVCPTILEINMVVSQKIVNQPTSGPRNIVAKGYSIIPKGQFSTIFIAALSIIAWIWKQLRCLSSKHNRTNVENVHNEDVLNGKKLQHMEICMQMDETQESSWVRLPRLRKIYMVCTHSWLDVIYKSKNNESMTFEKL